MLAGPALTAATWCHVSSVYSGANGSNSAAFAAAFLARSKCFLVRS